MPEDTLPPLPLSGRFSVTKPSGPTSVVIISGVKKPDLRTIDRRLEVILISEEKVIGNRGFGMNHGGPGGSGSRNHRGLTAIVLCLLLITLPCSGRARADAQ